jgi:glutamyl-tRNA reductase
MAILAIGVSYRAAPVELLERLAFPPEDDQKAYAKLLDSPAVAEAVILSTCNRVELFADVASYHAGFQELKRFLAESRDTSMEEFYEPLYAHYESHAAEHLFSVAAGIDSVVLGEPQILTQVRQAYRRSDEEGGVGTILGRLFRAAIRAGKRVRAETAIGASPAGFVEAGASLAARALGGLENKAATVVGAGGMAAMAVEHLRDRGMDPIRVVNRTPERAQRLAERVGGQVMSFDLLARAVASADLVVSSTGATGPVIGPSIVRKALADRGGRPLFLLDLAVPRDVDPAVRRLPGAEVANLDDLTRALDEAASNGAGHLAELDQARRIVDEEVERFESWRRASRLAPLIQGLRGRGEQIVAAELVRAAPRLGELSDREREAVEALARGIVAKLLHDPIVRLKELSSPGSGDAHGRALAELFGLSFPPPDGSP